MVTRPVTTNDILDGHVTLDIECLDRIYLNGYVPNLQVGGQVVQYLAKRGFPIPSPVVVGRIGDRFRDAVRRFSALNHIPVVPRAVPGRGGSSGGRSRWVGVTATRSPEPSAGCQHRVNCCRLRGVHRQAPAVLHVHDLFGVHATVGSIRRLPLRSVLVGLGRGDVVGDRDQLTVAQSVGELLALARGPGRCSGPPRLGKCDNVVMSTSEDA
jgi:hypothetical protein